ncbi:hypothetical protein B0H13DRAFT_2318432 [Mycena leptocephala]|nr:hypothetical protein B0H13DRAFT_2318432 [Mycena leptocephala]
MRRYEHFFVVAPSFALQIGVRILRKCASGCWDIIVGSITPIYDRSSLSKKETPPSLSTSSIFSSRSTGRTRGASAYPFLIIHLRHPEPYAQPVVLKLQRFDGPLTVQKDDPRDPSDTSEFSTFTVARVGQSVRELVGTWRYDVCYTMKCGIADLLVLAELSTERDGSRVVYPVALFLALETLCNGTVTRSTKRRAGAARCYSDIADDALMMRQMLLSSPLGGSK